MMRSGAWALILMATACGPGTATLALPEGDSRSVPGDVDPTDASTRESDASSGDDVALDGERSGCDSARFDHAVIEEAFTASLDHFSLTGGTWSLQAEALLLDAPASVAPIGNLALHGTALFGDFDLSVRAVVLDETDWDDVAIVLAHRGDDDYLVELGADASAR